MVDLTLRRMWRGGIHDHLGGGFARYATDERWITPHFEKLLYIHRPSLVKFRRDAEEFFDGKSA